MVSSAARYATYMKSRTWCERRATYFETFTKSCVKCRSRTSIHLHHRTYERMGKELDSDLVALCTTCHDAVHAHHAAVGGRLDVATAAFLGEATPVLRRRRSGPSKKQLEKERKARKLAARRATKAAKEAAIAAADPERAKQRAASRAAHKARQRALRQARKERHLAQRNSGTEAANTQEPEGG